MILKVILILLALNIYQSNGNLNNVINNYYDQCSK